MLTWFLPLVTQYSQQRHYIQSYLDSITAVGSLSPYLYRCRWYYTEFYLSYKTIQNGKAMEQSIPLNTMPKQHLPISVLGVVFYLWLLACSLSDTKCFVACFEGPSFSGLVWVELQQLFVLGFPSSYCWWKDAWQFYLRTGKLPKPKGRRPNPNSRNTPPTRLTQSQRCFSYWPFVRHIQTGYPAVPMLDKWILTFVRSCWAIGTEQSLTGFDV